MSGINDFLRERVGKGLLGRNRKLTIAILVLAHLIGFGFWFLFMPMGALQKTEYICIDDDDNMDSVVSKVEKQVQPHQMIGFRIMSHVFRYKDRVIKGRYEASPWISSFTLVRKLAKGHQSPVDLTFPATWTKEMLAARIADRIMIDSATIVAAMHDEDFCATLGLDTATIATILIPNTYELYWNIGAYDFLRRMSKESDAFWNDGRLKKAEAVGLTKEEVYILASIVDAETLDESEKPVVAGLYLNRMRAAMPLQADPTIKFALGRFDLKRIYGTMLRVDSPYNTYTHVGLPPGPIHIPSISSIDAVLNYKKHDFLYMCAKEDLSGTHNFARTFAEHSANAARYVRTLNSKQIR